MHNSYDVRKSKILHSVNSPFLKRHKKIAHIFLRPFYFCNIFRVRELILYTDLKEVNIIVAAVRKVKSKDRLAMNLLYARYVKEMLTLSYRMVNSLEEAEDIIQESFLTSFQKIDQLQDPINYSFWLKRIVVNNSIKASKSKIYFKPIEDDNYEDEQEEERWYEHLKFETINTSIQNLPNGCRDILTLYLLDGFKHREIADLYDISISTSKSQYRYALKLLKEQLI